MIRSVKLRPAEALLLEIMEQELQRKLEAAQEEAQGRLRAILRSLSLDEATKGSFQRDPFDKLSAYFLYDDGS